MQPCAKRKKCWASNGMWNLPMTVMTPVGSGIRGSIYHSHSFDATMTHIAGWKIVMPSNPLDAYGLMISCLKDPNPTMFLIPKALTRMRGEELLPGEPAEKDLKAMIDASQAAGARVLLIGMRIPPNYGPDYSDRFFAMYGKLSQQYKLPLVPFLLEGVAQRPDWFQEDRIHPIAAAQPTMLDNVWPKLEPLLKQRTGS